MQERVVRVIRTLRVMWRGLETGISYGPPRQSSTLPNSSSDTPVSAWVKSEELVTANGPYLSVSDAYDHNTYATTKETVGTTVWHRVEPKLCAHFGVSWRCRLISGPHRSCCFES